MSRLDRLLLLLDNGSSTSIRETAARQIAQFAAKNVAKDASADVVFKDTTSHVHQGTPSEWSDVMAVVAKILPYLRSKSTETRTAATSALSHICEMTPYWAPSCCSTAEFSSQSHPPPSPAPEFPPFSVAQLLSSGTLLLSSSGSEFTAPVALGTPAEIARARKDAMAKLGLGFMDSEELVEDLDKELAPDAPLSDHEMDVDEPSHDSSPAPGDYAPSSSASPAPISSPPTIKIEAAPISLDTVSLKHEREDSLLSSETAVSPTADPVNEAGLSARERNRLKRKRKLGNTAFVGATTNPTPVSKATVPSPKVRVVETSDGPSPRPLKPTKTERSSSTPGVPSGSGSSEKVVIDPTKGGQVEAKQNAAHQALNVPEGSWVWDGVVGALQVDLFSPNWEIRHGAAMALREIIRVRGAYGGMKEKSSHDDNFIFHEKWCNNLAAKFLCLFVLDRFSDFVSDQVVAPVRETVSQTLAALLTHMPSRSILHIHRALLEMIDQPGSAPRQTNGSAASHAPAKRGAKGKGRANGAAKDASQNYVWEVRHAGLVGIKYEVAVRPDLFDDIEDGTFILKEVVNAAVAGLRDKDDDVRSVAALCLTPIAQGLVERLPDHIRTVLDVLWDALKDMKDDLGSSVGFVMELLGKLLSFDTVISTLVDSESSKSLSGLVPALYPFFRHTIPGVRLAVVKTLHNFLLVPNLPDEWLTAPAIRLIYQNLILEEKDDVRNASLQAWRSAIARLASGPSADNQGGRLYQTIAPLIRGWFEVLMTPLGAKMETHWFYAVTKLGAEHGHNVDKSMIEQDLALISSETILRARVISARALAIVLTVWPVAAQQEEFGLLLDWYMSSPSMLRQFLTATIVHEWAVESDVRSPDNAPSLTESSSVATNMVSRFVTLLQSDPPPSYHEMHIMLARLATECRELLLAFETSAKVHHAKIPSLPTEIDINGQREDAFTITTATVTATTTFEAVKLLVQKARKKEIPALEERRKRLQLSIKAYTDTKEQHDARIAAAVAGALIALREMPPKLNPVIRSVMNGVKFEENWDLQARAARSVAAFAAFQTRNDTRSSPTDKIVKNLCTFIAQDVEFTPVFTSEGRDVHLGIFMVKRMIAAASVSKSASRGKDIIEEKRVTGQELVRRGAQMALSEMATAFGPKLFQTLPMLWECMAKPLLDVYGGSRGDMQDTMVEVDDEITQSIIDCLMLIHAVAPMLDASLHTQLEEVFTPVLAAVRSPFSLVRQCAAQCLATLCNVVTIDAMKLVVEVIIPLLGDPKVVENRQGAIEVIHNIVKLLDSKVLPYIIFLVVPVLGRMSDSNDDVRYLATNTFASLVKMVPLEAGLPDPPGFSADLLVKRETERAFLTQLLDGNKVEAYTIPVPIKAELRKYQQDGVNWLAFLAKFQLHGILCDDMGLGKTLQSICILASKHQERLERFKATQSPDSVHLPSLIVCPPTLVGHWYHEILKYTEGLRPVMYSGSTRERTKLAPTLSTYDVVITPYDVVRNDQGALARQDWHYCILDEGHIIKNAKAKLTRAVKTLKAQHRLILSGTPIQNNVLELWSLFDFLMPGFLGTEQYFNERFGKPITVSRDNKASDKARQAATVALEALHKQVLPFLLRRLKEDVLNDLPPKIIQDYYCDLSDLQKRLYDAYAGSQAQLSAEKTVQKANGTEGGEQKHVFQSLQYLRKICNHPALVVKNEQDLEALREPDATEPIKLNDIVHAPKLQALRQLLTDCGVGAPPAASDAKDSEPTPPPSDTADIGITQHRVLIFCQMKQMLDIIETDLFKTLMPTVTYMRLDGTTDPSKRHAIVETFNGDPSIDCLLLTTHIGGLGLTLTGADTVIFVEHDWNPMKDLQAMDRAHRLGQKKVVNVYRLITKGTLEEKIMGLQRFKLNIANSVITQQNAGLASMDTDLVLDLFKRTSEEEDAAAAKKRKAQDGPVTQKNVLEGLDDLPPETEYDFDLSNFLGTLRPSASS